MPILVCPRAVFGRGNQTRGYGFYAIALQKVQFLIKIALREGKFLMIFFTSWSAILKIWILGQ
jgi:hypothetical protein